jgi:hypothetical protein
MAMAAARVLLALPHEVPAPLSFAAEDETKTSVCAETAIEQQISAKRRNRFILSVCYDMITSKVAKRSGVSTM